jgi:glucosamine-6-phosphate deaminase
MEVVILPAPEDVARLVADAIEALLKRNPDAVLGLATGTSPLLTYEELIDRRTAGRISFAAARAFLLDEYIGLPAGHPQSYRSVIEREFTGQVDFADGAVQGPDGSATDIPAACEAYEAAIKAADGIDLQLLGIGADGHIGFNEPTSSLASRTRVKTLTDKTRADNARFFSNDDEVPRHVITQGIGSILDARHVVLIGTGPTKAIPIQRAVEGPVAAICPGSALQLHPHASVVIDESAAGRLALADYYKATWSAKPAWQSL